VSSDSSRYPAADQGRLQAVSSGLDKLDNELANAGFLRVHRRYVVNLSRVREVERRDRGELVLIMDDKENTIVPVSRRNARGTPCAWYLKFDSRRKESHAGEP
jgi:sigma-54 dependent transcriptional regulator, acetoin dehydrogenase operon transcriptional activator AcoR